MAMLLSLSLPLDALGQSVPSSADTTRTFVVRYPFGQANVSERVGENEASLRALQEALRQAMADSSLTSVQFGGFASPDGPTLVNQRLTARRANALRQWVTQRINLSPYLLPNVSGGVLYDWMTLYRLVEASSLPDRQEVLSLIHRAFESEDPDAACIASLQSLRQGETWRWLRQHAFPLMRNAYALVSVAVPRTMEDGAEAMDQHEEALNQHEMIQSDVDDEDAQVALHDEDALSDEGAQVTSTDDISKPFYLNLRTNLLYDAALVPNVGLEVSLGHHWSLGTNWAWAWWSRRASDRYWRVFGGEVNLRKWFGSARPLTGHHVGVYAEALTYDVMLSSHRGFLGGKPGSSLLSHPSWNAGAEYGFCKSIGRRLSLDFSLGVGYFRTTYYQYTPVDVHYVWTGTKRKSWVGPTKAEISLVWRIGCEGHKEEKGGER
jgi:hypothetical protein